MKWDTQNLENKCLLLFQFTKMSESLETVELKLVEKKQIKVNYFLTLVIYINDLFPDLPSVAYFYFT